MIGGRRVVRSARAFSLETNVQVLPPESYVDSLCVNLCTQRFICSVSLVYEEKMKFEVLLGGPFS